MPYEKVLELVCQIILKVLENQPPEVAAELWRRHMDFLAKCDDVFGKLSKLGPPHI